MSEAIKQATTAAEDYAYSTPLDELDVSNPRIFGRTRNIGRYLSVFAMKTLCTIAQKLGKTHIAWTTTEVLEPIGL